MPVRTVCACGAVYNLKDEYAGRRLGCPRCGGAVEAPALPPAPPVREQEGDPAFARDKFLLHERHLGISEKYSVTDPGGAPLMFVERPNYIFLNVLAIFGGLAAGLLNFLLFAALNALSCRAGLDPLFCALLAAWARLGSALVVVMAAQALSRKRPITVYRDDKREEVLLRVTQDSRLQLLTASYTVTDPEGRPLAVILKKRLKNIFRKRWYGFGPGGQFLFLAKEDSAILSVLRRMMLGFFGLLHTDFIIYSPGGAVLGEFNRRLTVRDRYVLDLGPDSLRSLDRRVALALGVLLDTGEGR